MLIPELSQAERDPIFNANYKYILGCLNCYVTIHNVTLLFCSNKILHTYVFDYTEIL